MAILQTKSPEKATSGIKISVKAKLGRTRILRPEILQNLPQGKLLWR